MNCKDCCQDCQRIGCDIEVNCTGYVKKPKTNADRIRSMTDEGLSEFMCHNISNGTVNCAFCAAAEFCRMGHNGWLDWLRQESEGEQWQS